ncbi:hypothetical protein CAPTEDRAFT_174165 [Capitella teleta]|uniref:Uncharacterized protein n=1 Tax=Capitella teleta TaxID=283909 RepID=R7V638_CAPTE|nr:hypothetical protein CAPTEDRAFT_174165 [Capitella teleta]|eukprot:ELU13947.1 hypothetical protein CAPTEDRAFT_174165 [Capitella teleta]
MSKREFDNAFPDYNGENLLGADSSINSEFAGKIRGHVSRMLDALENGLSKGVDWKNYSVYTGTTGVAYLYFHLYTVLDDCQEDRFLKKALSLLEPCLTHLGLRRVSFLQGDAGPLALATVVYHLLGRSTAKQDCLERLLEMKTIVYDDHCLPEELLNGRIGYLYALLFVNHHLGADTIDKLVVYRVYETVLKNGRQFAKEERSKFPLMYEWHDKKYLGAAHGLAGILYLLLQIREPVYQKYSHEWIEPSIEMLMTLRFPSGNYPSSIGSASGDKLVQWCHGAPGWVPTFCMAHKTYGEPKYLDEALKCGEVIWCRGLLRKGYGLCHGSAGNAYAFLSLFRATNDQKHLHRACQFAEWCFQYGSHGCRNPDRPLSLFEGLAGTIYFLTDLLKPMKSRFPAFEL